MSDARGWDDLVLVGRVARTHGIRGQVVVNPETDFPEERFRVGAGFSVRWAGGEERVTVAESRLQGRRPVVRFEGIASIEDAERLVGLELRVPESELVPLDRGVYYHHQLVGCRVETLDGAAVGTVVRVEGGAGTSLLVVEGAGGEILVPLAAGICVEVDVGTRRITVDAPEGLLELNAAGQRTPRERA